jgi:uncharacterized YigZ family protein
VAYQTIKGYNTSTYKIKGSKFLGFAIPLQSEIDVKKELDKLKLQFPDANHHCFAYRLNSTIEILKANDAGEPNGTAGLPILGQIRSSNLTNVLVVVVRYFGGTLLGAGGLKDAYKESARLVLETADIITVHETAPVAIECDIKLLDQVMGLLKSLGLKPKPILKQGKYFLNADLPDEIILKLKSIAHSNSHLIKINLG